MNQLLTIIPAHFDGEHVQFDADVELKPNTRLHITIIPEEVHYLRQVRGTMQVSETSFARVWNNDEDAIYDRL